MQYNIDKGTTFMYHDQMFELKTNLVCNKVCQDSGVHLVVDSLNIYGYGDTIESAIDDILCFLGFLYTSSTDSKIENIVRVQHV